ncbi:uncharacterized protein A4U43_C07F24010 [Asparagus officinalis]|uniref:Uncharacterized protein n=1 Tax=Asparagus officinalis TaxID=4686 RepID=A0A5P1EEF8_ASPOF|nr:uncharacterized protein A4U43_C07F24010 [Asparagus officinalis]
MEIIVVNFFRIHHLSRQLFLPSGVGEEGEELGGDGVGMDELEEEAAGADAELEGGDGVVVVGVAGAPLDVETDDEAVEAMGVEGEDA